MVHTLKVIWTSDFGESEIRRLTIHDDVISRYSLLAEKIVKLFPQLNGQYFQLGWKDSEGDYIVMSSDDELAQAVANAVENGLIKVFVTTKASKNVEQKPKSTVVHPRVVCDGCNGSVYGYRYKCLECLDYDLCELCHQEDKHPGHDMLKISTPVGQSHNWKFPGWKRMYRSMFGRQPFGLRCDSGKKFVPKHSEEAEKKGEEKSGATNPHVEFLRNIGKSVAFFLDPLGIDVDVMVSESDTDANNSSGSKKGSGSQSEAAEEEPKNMAEQKIELDKNNENGTDNKSDASEAKDEETANTTSPQNEDSSTESSTQGARPKNYGLFQKSDYSCGAKVDSKESRESSPENFNGHDDWTVVNNVPSIKDDKSDVVAECTVTPSEKVCYPELPEEKMPSGIGAQNDIPILQDPKIANALSKMCAMGFTNEGGWLSRLLETKNGNINDVLDALYPHRH